MESSTSSFLNEPLYRFSGSEITSPSRKVKGDQYLPPYRYDENEIAFNKYLSSDEAYATVAKALLFEAENNIGGCQPYDIVIRTLAISQIKMFADAHMEKALLIPTFPERHEPPNITLMRKIDSVFGAVLLEFFASKDGILLGPQVETLTKNTTIKEMKVLDSRDDNDDVHVSTPNRKNRTFDNNEEVANDMSSISASSPSQENTPTVIGSNVQSAKEKDEEIHFQLDSYKSKSNETKNNPQSSFDKLYSIDEMENGVNSKVSTNKSKLKQEILGEIDRLKLEIQSTDSEDEKERYKGHLQALVTKLDRYSNHSDLSDADSFHHDERYKTMEEESPLPKSREINDRCNTNRDMNTRTTNLTSNTRGIITTSSHDRMMQSRGFVHISDVERGFKVVKVIAHDYLKDGTLFQAQYRDKSFTIRVPPGGVKAGEVFSSPMLHPSGQSDSVVHYECLIDTMEIPRGHWRDRLFQCFNDPMLSMSCLCPNAALSQIRTRMKFQDIGEVTCGNKVKSLVCFNLLVLFLHMWTILALLIVVDEVHLWLAIACWVPLGIIDAYLVYKFIALTIRTRREAKARYDITKNEVHGLTEASMVSCCSCCVISQMSRHTADYKMFREEYLSATGLPSNMEILLPIMPKRRYCHPNNVDGKEEDDGNVFEC